MRTLIEIARTGVTAAMLHPLRSLVCMGCLVIALVPYLTGVGISQGLWQEANASIRFGADLYVSEEQLGRSVPIRLGILPEIRKLPGVTSAIPRIVGQVALGLNREPVVVVGLPAASVPSEIYGVEGRLFRDGGANELVMGTELARRLHLHLGSIIPPFYYNNSGERLSKVVGLFRSNVPLWQSRMMLTSFETASAIFAQNGTAGDVLVYCRPGDAESVRAEIRHLMQSVSSPQGRQSKIVTRSDLKALIPAGLSYQSGLFQLHFLLAFVAGILAILACSGIGARDRLREIGLLKATGWQIDELLIRGVAESSILGISAASLSLILAFIWLKVFNGFGIAFLLLPGAGWTPSFDIPCQLTPVPALLGYLFAWIIVTIGTLSAIWRTAIVPHRVALR